MYVYIGIEDGSIPSLSGTDGNFSMATKSFSKHLDFHRDIENGPCTSSHLLAGLYSMENFNEYQKKLPNLKNERRTPEFFAGNHALLKP